MNGLDAKGLRRRLGQRLVLADATLALHPGELVLLAGRNGAGKSTLLRLLIGALAPDAGSVELLGRPLTQWRPDERARQLAFVPQSVDTPFEFTGRELVAMGRHPHRARSQAMQDADRAAIERALAAVDGVEFADRRVTTLSGGEQRRIAIARALATEAPLLLLDEPTNNLDLEHALQLVAMLRRLAATGRGALIASHDLNLFARHCDRVVLLHEGVICCSGPPEQALAPEQIAKVFGVRSLPPSGYFPREFSL